MRALRTYADFPIWRFSLLLALAAWVGLLGRDLGAEPNGADQVNVDKGAVNPENVDRENVDILSLDEDVIEYAISQVRDSLVRIELLGEKGLLVTTGVVLTDDGLIVASDFAFKEEPTSILVTLPSGSRQTAKIQAGDSSRGLKILKVDTNDTLKPAKAVDRSNLFVGQSVIALGKTSESKEPLISVGILSATNRAWGRAVQTDAKISPRNYGGPLLDSSGQVIGILTAITPFPGFSSDEMYDSGIGFAAPFSEILGNLPAFREGKNLRPGLAGISFEPGNPFSVLPRVALCRQNSPAYAAGIRIGDVIVEVNGRLCPYQNAFRHLIGPLYAGETAKVVYTRGDERHTATIPLTDEIAPVATPFLGFLPQPDDPSRSGVCVRDLLPGGPLEKSEMLVGDWMVRLNDKDIANAAELQRALADLSPGSEVSIRYKRDGKAYDAVVRLAEMDGRVFASKSPRRAPAPQERNEAAPVVEGRQTFKLPEFPNDCHGYIPARYTASNPAPLVIWIAENQTPIEKFESIWKSIADRDNLLVIAPQPNEKEWSRPDSRTLSAFLQLVKSQYAIDPHRVVIVADGKVANIGAWLSIKERETIRGLGMIGGAFLSEVENDTLNRLSVLIVEAGKKRKGSRDRGNREKGILERLEKAKIPFDHHEPKKDQVDVASHLQLISEWVDGLDRL